MRKRVALCENIRTLYRIQRQSGYGRKQVQVMEINDLNGLIQHVSSYADASETKQVLTAAYGIAEGMHRGFFRMSGVPVIDHALAVAANLAEWRAPLPVLATGLLHDCRSPENSHGCNFAEIERQLGYEVGHMVEAVSALNEYVRRIERDFEREGHVKVNLDAMMSLLRDEPDIVIVKLADRLHNLQTITALKRDFQERTARIGFNVLVPLADRLGMDMVKRQLEDLSFRVVNPTEYQKSEQQYQSAEDDPPVQSVCDELSRAFAEQRLPYRVRWQASSLYSLYRRQVERRAGQSKSPRSALVPLRTVDTGWFIVLTGSEMECYHALGLVHKLYQPVRGMFKDLIAAGKENGYRALHTDARHNTGQVLHIAIRTRDMDIIAERGITARWWNVPESLLPQLAQKNRPMDGNIQVFTSKSEIKRLPRGATVLDFAYVVHTEIGDSCAGALVNGEHVDAYTPLQDGDRVEIITGGDAAQPDIEWLQHVRTYQAASAIRQWLLLHRRNAMIERGRHLLDQYLKPLTLNAASPQVSELLNRLAVKEGLERQEELLAAIGVGRLDAHKVVRQLQSMRVGEINTRSDAAASLSVRAKFDEETTLLPVLAHCCSPVPFDEIVAFRSAERLIVHKRSCAQVKHVEQLLPVEWDTDPAEPHYVAVVEAVNRPGLAHDLTKAITEANLDMTSFTAHERPGGTMAEARIYLNKTTPMQRARIQKALESVPYVTGVEIVHSSPLTSFTQQTSAPLLRRVNPFGPGIAKGERFFGRAIESERIVSYLCDPSESHSIVIWGQKRIGKTSLVLHLPELAQERFIPIYIDMQAIQSGTNTHFLHLLAYRISLALRDYDLSQEVTAPSLKHMRKDPLGYFDTFMSLAQQVIGTIPLVIILDEFQCLCDLREEQVERGAVFSRLRSQSLHGHGLHLLLSGGGSMSRLLEQTGIVSLLNVTHDEKLMMLEDEAAHDLVKKGFADVGHIEEPAIEFLLKLTANHPYYLQLLCWELHDRARRHHFKITRDIVKSVVDEWLAHADRSRFQHLWEGHDQVSGPRNHLILSAIAELRGYNDAVEYGELVRRIGHVIPEDELVRALDDLTTLGIIKHEHAFYAIRVRLFMLWLRLHWPLAQTLKAGGWA